MLVSVQKEKGGAIKKFLFSWQRFFDGDDDSAMLPIFFCAGGFCFGRRRVTPHPGINWVAFLFLAVCSFRRCLISISRGSFFFFFLCARCPRHHLFSFFLGYHRCHHLFLYSFLVLFFPVCMFLTLKDGGAFLFLNSFIFGL